LFIRHFTTFNSGLFYRNEKDTHYQVP